MDTKTKVEICKNLTDFYNACIQRPYEYHSELPSCNIVKHTLFYIGCNEKKTK